MDHSDWATPIVTVPKKDGKVRICGDYGATVNQVLDVDQYPLLRSEEMFTALADGKRFTKLNLSHAYNQLRLDQNARQYLMINTRKGFYRYTRLPLEWRVPLQSSRETILQGLPGVL